MTIQNLTPKFEHAALEQDIEKISAEMGASPEAGQENYKEVLKAALGRRIFSEEKPAPSQEKMGEPSPVLPAYLQNSDKDTKLKVEKLVDLAWHRGVNYAIKEAKKSEPLILDAFHDSLTDKLYDEFKKRGLFK